MRRRILLGLGRRRPVVVVFMRGGADGLNLVIPQFERTYFDRRPTLAVRDGVRLDDRFNLHPGLRPLAEIASFVHAVGSDDATRSHFEAQDHMERGGGAGGWIARCVGRGPLSAVAIGRTPPESMRGAASVAFESASEFRFRGDASRLARLYDGDDALCRAGAETIETLRAVERIAGEPGDGYTEIARLIRADVGVEVAHLDAGGWDSHIAQAAYGSQIAALGERLAWLHGQIGDRARIVVMTEFGRRAYENVSLGTDHGRGGVMTVMGAGIRAGRVVTEWPGLEEDQLDDGDLRVTIDYREILAEVLDRDDVFPEVPLRRRLTA